MKRAIAYAVALLVPILLIIGFVLAANVVLTWQRPTTNTDGTPLTDLAGFNVYWGSQSRLTTAYTHSVKIGNVTTYTVSSLTTGTHYFAVTAYNTSNIESDYSNEVVKYIPGIPNPPTGLLGTVTGVGVS